MLRKWLGALCVPLFMLMLAVPAQATVPKVITNGTWGTSNFTCPVGITMQGVYTNDSSSGTKTTRASGGGGFWSFNGALTQLQISEWNRNVQKGIRTINYDPARNFHSVSVTGISTSYLPAMTDYADTTQTMTVAITTTAGSCVHGWVIGN